ncbi:MAG: hypothetical protein ACFFBP_02775 [Promethearchaeota archaeon]
MEISILSWILCATIITNILILLIGYSFLYFLPNNEEFTPLKRFSLSYGLGVGLLSFSMLIFILFGLHSRISFIPILAISSFLFIYFKIYKVFKNDIKEILNLIRKPKLKLNTLEYFSIIIIIIEIFYLISTSLIYPVYIWDSAVIWDAKARYLFYDGNFNYLNYTIVHPDYPPLVPLVLTSFYSLFFQPHHFIQLFFVTIFICMIIFLYYSLRHFKLNRTYSLLISSMIALVYEIYSASHFVGGDLLVAFYYTISTIFLCEYIFSRRKQFLIYSSIFMGFMALSKNEGFGLLIVNVGVLVLYQILFCIKKEIKFKEMIILIILFAGIGLMIYVPWLVLISINNVGSAYLSNILNIFIIQNTINKLIDIITFILLQFLWIPFLILFFTVIIINIRTIYYEKLFFLVVLMISHLLLYILVYLITPYDLIWQLGTSIQRELMHLTPFAGFILGVVLIHIKNFDLEYKKENNSYQKIFLYISIIAIIFFVINSIIFNNL